MQARTTKEDDRLGALDRSIPRFCALLLSGCALTSTAPNFNGLKNFDGSEGMVHINLTKVAVHLGVVFPFIGDASLDGTVEEFTKAALKVGANRVRIVQSDETTL